MKLENQMLITEAVVEHLITCRFEEQLRDRFSFQRSQRAGQICPTG